MKIVPLLISHLIAFTSAFLGFWLQLMVSKSILPDAGGLPIVWITSVLLFQCLVLISYIYGIGLEKLSQLKNRGGLIIQVVFLTLACIYILPLTRPTWDSTYDQNPVAGVLWTLSLSVGLIFILLSVNSLLMTNTLKASIGENSLNKAYAIFATSNAGSFLGLLAYPLVVESWLSLETQHLVWSIMYGCVTILTLLLLLLLRKKERLVISKPQKKEIKKTLPNVESLKKAASLSLKIISLTATSSFIFLGATTYFSIALLPISLIWVLPLAAYLLAWVVAFTPGEKKAINRQRNVTFAVALAILNTTPLPITILLPINVIIVYILCLGLHSKVYQLKDEIELNLGPSICYGLIALGGILGNILSLTLINRFDTKWILFLACNIALLQMASNVIFSLKNIAVEAPDLKSSTKPKISQATLTKVSGIMKLSLVILFLLSYLFLSKIDEIKKNKDFLSHGEKIEVLFKRQGPLGRLIVEEETSESDVSKKHRYMTINKVLQGNEVLGKENSTYGYLRLKTFIRSSILPKPEEPKTWLGLGLGVGTIAAAGKTGDTIKIAEINPHVIEAAQEHFSYLKGSKSNIELLLGDGRKILTNQKKSSLDIIICDAYAGGSVPQHMMTKEFFETCLDKLKEDGVIAIHISHSSLDLKPTLAAIGQTLGLITFYTKEINKGAKGADNSEWILFMRVNDHSENKRSEIKAIGFKKIRIPNSKVEKYLWTDNFSSIIQALKTTFRTNDLIIE